MGMIMNASCETVHTVVYGNHFTLKPGQMKNFTDHVGRFMAIERRYLGLVGLPDECEDPEFVKSPEGQAVLERARKEGIENRCKFLRELIYNNQVSLKNDLDRANIKADVRGFASEGEIAAMQELVKYQVAKDDTEAKKVEEIKKLEEKIGKVTIK
jgi:hypothetical protein